MNTVAFFSGFVVGMLAATIICVSLAVLLGRIHVRKATALIAVLEDDIEHRTAEIVILRQQLNHRRDLP